MYRALFPDRCRAVNLDERESPSRRLDSARAALAWFEKFSPLR
jgi:hypothetical protein